MIGCDCAVCNSTDPRDKRLRASILVQSATTTLVVDTGPDFRYQMLREKIKVLDAVLFTHSHKDHIAGLDDVKAYNFSLNRPMDLYASAATAVALQTEFFYAFSATRYPGIPNLNLHTIGMEPFVIGDIPVIPVLVWHLTMPVLGFRFGNFTYVTDANRIDATEQEKIKGSEVLLLDALRKEKHLSHFTLKEAIELAGSLKIPTTYLTHISHQMGLHKVVEAELPAGIHLGYDGLRFSVNGS